MRQEYVRNRDVASVSFERHVMQAFTLVGTVFTALSYCDGMGHMWEPFALIWKESVVLAAYLQSAAIHISNNCENCAVLRPADHGWNVGQYWHTHVRHHAQPRTWLGERTGRLNKFWDSTEINLFSGRF